MVVNRLLRPTWISRASLCCAPTMVSPSKSPSRALLFTIAVRSVMSTQGGSRRGRRAVPHAGYISCHGVAKMPEVAARALIVPDHPVDPFMAEGDPTRVPQPEADLLRAPAFGPQLAGDGATLTECQIARLVPDLRMSGLRRALRLCKTVAPLPRVPGEFPAHCPLAHPSALPILAWVMSAFRQA